MEKTEAFKQINYLKKGTGPVLMLIHGFPENHGLWNLIIKDLSEHFTVIAPDTPGSGDSILEQSSISITTVSEYIKQIIDKENIAEFVLAGHSMGGYISLAFAEKYGHYLKGLSLVHSTATADDEGKKEKRAKTIELIRKGGKKAFVKEMIPKLFSKKFSKENQEVIHQQIERAMQLSDSNMMIYYEAMMNRPDRTHILKNAVFPVQMIIGAEDEIAPMDALLAQAAMAEINFMRVYENCLHMSMLEQPARLVEDLLNFTNYCYRRSG